MKLLLMVNLGEWEFHGMLFAMLLSPRPFGMPGDQRCGWHGMQPLGKSSFSLVHTWCVVQFQLVCPLLSGAVGAVVGTVVGTL